MLAQDVVNDLKLLKEMKVTDSSIPSMIDEDAMSTLRNAGNAVKDFGKQLGKEANINNPNGIAGQMFNDGAAKIKAVIKKIVAWVKTAWAKLSAIIMNDTRFIQQYEKELRSKANMFDATPIKLPNIKPLSEILGINTENPSMVELMSHDKQWYDAKTNELNQANNNLKILRDTTIGNVGGIIKIIDTMKKHAEYGKSAADGISKLADANAVNMDETDNQTAMACGRCIRMVAMYRINMAAARHKAYKAALIKAIGIMHNAQEAAIEGAVVATEAVIDRYMTTITEMFSDTGFENSVSLLEGETRELTYDKVDSYQQNPEKPADGTKGDVVGQCTTTLNVQESDFSGINNLADVIDESKLAKYITQTVLEAREILRQGR